MTKEQADARRVVIEAALAAAPLAPDFSDQGRSVQLVAYRKSLLDELEQLNRMFPPDAQVFEIVSRHRAG